MSAAPRRLYSYVFPALGIGLAAILMMQPALAPGRAGELPAFMGFLATVLLCGSAFATIFHSDLVAERVGQPLGTLVLTLSVTLIEVAVIASMMMHKEDNPTLAREAVFSVIMIVNTGIIGLCLLLGSLRHREQTIRQQGISGFLSVMIALAVLLLVLPSVTRTSSVSGAFSTFQLVVMTLVAVALYGAFLYMQTVRHRDHYDAEETGSAHARPDGSAALLALGMLVLSLVAVVALAKHVAASVETVTAQLSLPNPDAVAGALLAALVLMPEGIAAVRAAARNHLQFSLNIALGSVLATIALTIPVMAVISVWLGLPMVLGLEAEERTLMLLTFGVAILSFGTGRTNALNGIVLLIIFAVYVMLLFEP